MRKNKKLVFVITSLFLATLWGCGSNMDSGGNQTQGATGTFGADAAAIEFVGASTCINCHKGFSWSAEAVADYLLSKHVVHSSHITQKLAQQSGCAQCHDPIGDGRTLEGLIDPANVPADGLAAVTCEACHGAGGEHFGVGPIPKPRPDYATCGNCHAVLPSDHLAYHPEANNIVTDFESSRHLVGSLRNRNVCVKCHSDEGAKLYVNIDDSTRLFTLAVPVDPASKIQCRTCHNSHNPGELLEPAITSGSSAASAEYRTCTNCHQAHNATVGTALSFPPGTTVTATSDGATDTNGGQLIYHAARLERLITDSHYDDPATPAAIEGYTMSKTNDRVCRDCHNVHSANVTINTQWAESAHGGGILGVKEAAATAVGITAETLAQTIAVKAAAVTTTGDAWVHYDWDASNRNSCQRCHTSTGLKNFLANTAGYDSTANNYSHLVGWSKDATTGVVTSSGQNEMLYCWGCHANNSGALRDDPNGITLDFKYEDPNGVVGDAQFIVLPNKGNSNVCAVCHAGRGNDFAIRTGTRSTRFAGHHAPTAGTLYAATTHTGFEFVGVNYANAGFESAGHPSINASTDGPCVSCHMAGTANHTFEALDVAGTAINSQALCDTCHGAGVMTYTLVKDREAQQANASKLLTDILKQLNLQTNYLAINVSLNTATVEINAYGAFQNSLYIGSDELCAFVHNPTYARRLIFDSIDWMDNGVLDGTITIPAGYDGAAAWFGTTAGGIATRP